MSDQEQPVSVRNRRARKGGDVAAISAYVPVRMARAVKVRAATTGATVSSIVAEALRAHLGPQECGVEE